MNAFEFVFTLFGLMLGFSLAELLGGFVRMLKARPAARIGWLTPLLAMFVMLDLTSFWANIWEMRDIPVTYGTLVIGLVASGFYYVAASLIFPDRLDADDALDAHYFLRRRPVLAIVAGCNAVVIAAMSALAPAQVLSTAALVTHSIYYAALLTAAFARPRGLNLAALGVLVALYLFYATMTMILPSLSSPG